MVALRQQSLGYRAFRPSRRLVGAVLTLMYLLVSAGIPLPVERSSLHSRERFPCESCGCGCDSAEHCWRSCCCHTLAERLAWAAENDVIAPDFALAEARAAGLDSTGRPFPTQRAALGTAFQECCVSHSCCNQVQSRSCCSSHIDSDRTRRNPEKKTDYLVGWRALNCQGNSLGWLAAVPSLTVVGADYSPQLLLTSWLRPLNSEHACEVTLAPSLPPPEQA